MSFWADIKMTSDVYALDQLKFLFYDDTRNLEKFVDLVIDLLIDIDSNMPLADQIQRLIGTFRNYPKVAGNLVAGKPATMAKFTSLARYFLPLQVWNCPTNMGYRLAESMTRDSTPVSLRLSVLMKLVQKRSRFVLKKLRSLELLNSQG